MLLEPQTSTRHARGFFTAILLASSFFAIPAHAQEAVVRGEPVSKSDIAALNPVCRLIMENPGIHHSQGQIKNAALFDRPEYNMAKGNSHLHHYCWALIHKQRYFRERSKTKRNFYFSQYLYDIDYVLKNSSKSWPYFDVLHLELASTYLIRADYPSAIKSIDDALRFKPDSEKAYLLKSDALREMGKKETAIKIAQEGLAKNPESSPLRRRLVKLGITPPEPPPPSVNVPPANAEAGGTQPDAGTATAPGSETNHGSPATEEGVKELQSDPSPATSEPAPAIEAKSEDSQNSPDGSQPRKNPYCRFCPD